MNYEIVTTDDFERNFRKLSKKYRSLQSDYDRLIKDLLANPAMGDEIAENTRKVRMAIASKNKGKSGGARVITCHLLVDIVNTEIYLLTIYDKSESENISGSQVKQLKAKNGLI